jgi:hypothetical protein
LIRAIIGVAEVVAARPFLMICLVPLNATDAVRPLISAVDERLPPSRQSFASTEFVRGAEENDEL